MTTASQEWNVQFAVSFLNIVWNSVFNSNVHIQAADTNLCSILVGHNFLSHGHSLTQNVVYRLRYRYFTLMTAYLGQNAHII